MLVKVCGICREEQALWAAEAGADFCGFIFHPQSPRNVAPKWVAKVPTGKMKRVGVFVKQEAKEILEIMAEARLDYAQLHGEQSVDCALAIGRDKVIRVLWPERFTHRAQLYAKLLSFAESSAYYLLDAGEKGGGSGRSLDWADLAGLDLPHPWFLAGGLKASNVLAAVAESKPDGVDFNSGLEDQPGVKSQSKIFQCLRLVHSHIH